jgi:2-dehydro-3-deoxyglucarate aldolase
MKLKDRIRRGELTYGSWMTLSHPAIAEVLATAGFEWIVVDLEHSIINIREAGELIRVIDLRGMGALVRLTSNDANLAKRVLDAGAHGVIVPMIMNAGQARDAVAAVKYPPAGRRGVGVSRAHGFGTRFAKYVSTSNDESIVIAQIEHHEAIANLEDILAVPGIDGTMIGPYDMSASMGKPGQFDDPDVKKALARYETVSKAVGKPMGYHVVEPDATVLKEKIARGYTILAVSVDFMFLGHACRSLMNELRAAVSPERTS